MTADRATPAAPTAPADLVLTEVRLTPSSSPTRPC